MEPRVFESRFVTSAATLEQSPPVQWGEVAFVGRSNVGKSTLLNTLTQRKNLAKCSATPGKTRLINYFEVVYGKEEEKFPLYFVDLPGFGYAKVSKSLKSEWQHHLNRFIKGRRAIRLFVHLRDARHPNQSIDDEVKAYIKGFLQPDQCYLEVMTKADKLKQKEIGALKREKPSVLLVSSVKRSGIDALNARIFSVAVEGVSCP